MRDAAERAQYQPKHCCCIHQLHHQRVGRCHGNSCRILVSGGSIEEVRGSGDNREEKRGREEREGEERREKERQERGEGDINFD